MLSLTAQAGALSYLAQRLEPQAPTTLTSKAEFKPLVDAVNASANTLDAALQKQDEAAVKEAIGKLFAKFG